MQPTRRQLCSTAISGLAVGLAGCSSSTGGGGRTDWAWQGSLPVSAVQQYHDPSCGCCSEYVDYLEANGLDVEVETTDDLAAAKADLGVPEDAHSCHTVVVGDYIVEGHVPLQAIEALFDEEPDVDGVTIPGMPRYAPGMGPPDDEPLTVYAFDEDGTVEPFVDI